MTSVVIDGHDWVGPQNVLNRTQQVYAAHVPAGLSTVGPFDVSQVSSLGISIAANDPATAGAWIVVFAAFISNGVQIATRQISLPAKPAGPTSTATQYWRIPIAGDQVQLTIYCNSAAGVDITAIGMTRVLEAAETSFFTQGRPALLDTGAISVPATSNSASFYLPPTDHGYHVMYSIAGTGAVTFRAQGAYLFASTVALSYFMDAAATNGVDTLVQIPIPFVGSVFFFNNATAGAVTCAARIWERSP